MLEHDKKMGCEHGINAYGRLLEFVFKTIRLNVL